MKKYMVSLLAAVFLMMGWTVSADAAPKKPTPKQIERICATSGRSNPDYRKYCMVVGSPRDGVSLWYSVPLGRRTDADGTFSRHAMCKFSGEYEGIRFMVREALFDVAFDRYLNESRVLNAAGITAMVDCWAMGYRV